MNRDNRCTGCMACKNVCPVSCISIMSDNIGNFVKKIDTKECINCGRCEAVCPIVGHNEFYKPQKAYVACSKKININRKSASGGVAASVYEYCIKNNIRCIGVKYSKQLKAKYDFVDSVESIKDFIGSKYVYSHMNTIYKKVIMYLKKREKIVFIGLPCHVAALQNVTKEYNDNLICIDIVCHGIVAEKFLAEHLDNMVERKERECITSIDFREEKNPYGITLKGKNGEIIKRKSKNQDEYMLGYCQGFTYCEECYKCQYARKERCSDLTIKDFCGNMGQDILSKQRYGLSNILVNTDKGEWFMEGLSSYLNIFDYSVEKVILEDERLRIPTPKSWKRVFVKLYLLIGFDLSVRVLCAAEIFKDKLKQRYRV